MSIRIFVSGICVAGFLAQVLPADPPADTRAKTEAHRIAMQRGSSYLGIAVVEIDSDRAKALHLKEERGVEVTCLDPGSPAEKAGLKAGDVVLEYNGEHVQGGEQFIRLVRETPAGHTAKLVVWRNGANETLTAAVGQRPPGAFAFQFNGEDFTPEMPPMPPTPVMPSIQIPDIPRSFMTWGSPVLGIESETLNPQLAEYFGVKEGVLVRSVSANSSAEKAGFKAGDVIIKVDGQKVTTPREISSILQSARSRKTLPVTVLRRQKEVVLNVMLEENSYWQALETKELL